MNKILLQAKTHKTRYILGLITCMFFLAIKGVPVYAATLTPDINGYVSFSWSSRLGRNDGTYSSNSFDLGEVESITATVGACSGPKVYGAQRVPGYSRVYVVSEATGEEVMVAEYSSYSWPGGSISGTKTVTDLPFTGLAHLKVELSSPGTNSSDDPGYADADIKILCKPRTTSLITWSGSAEKTLTTNGSVHSGGHYGSVDEYITATNNIANFSTIQGTIYNSTTQAVINNWYTANASASITVAIVNTRTGQTITSENITKSNNGHYQNNPLTSSTNASLSGTKDFMFDLNALREAGHKMSECELRVIFNISHAVDQANETTTMGVSDVFGVQSFPSFNSNLTDCFYI